MKGEIWDFLIHPNGWRELIDRSHNLVVNTAYVVVAMAMKLDPANGGFMYWALGDGNTSDTSTWDAGVDDGSIVPQTTDTQLAREIYRKAIQASDIQYIDSLGNVSASPTNRLQITVTFNENEPGAGTYYLREWGIFGGDATGTAGSGYLINRKVHRTYEKTNLSKLERVLRFTF